MSSSGYFDSFQSHDDLFVVNSDGVFDRFNHCVRFDFFGLHDYRDVAHSGRISYLYPWAFPFLALTYNHRVVPNSDGSSVRHHKHSVGYVKMCASRRNSILIIHSGPRQAV